MSPTPPPLSPVTQRALNVRGLRNPEGLVLVLLLLAFAGLYLFTLDNGLRPGELEGGDLITHQYAQVEGRFSNAPGYPLYTMGGWLWYRVGRLLSGPGANPIPILSSYSTLWALIALALLYVLILDVTRRNWPLALLATAFYGLTYFFWYYAVTTEQYTSSVAWTLAVVLLAFRWQERRTDGYLYALALLMGAGLAHQITVLAILPPLAWFVWREGPSRFRKPRRSDVVLVLRLALLAALPLISYAYVYIRGAQHPEWRGAGTWNSTLDWFLAFVSTGQGRGELTWALQPFFTAEFPSLMWGEMTWPGLLAGFAGIATLGRRRSTLLYATLAIYLVFCWIDRLGNWYQVIMPVYALLALGLAAGAAWLLRRTPAGGARKLATAAALLALVALAAYRGAVSYPRADSSNRPDDTALDPAWAILADNPPASMPVLGTQREALSLGYVTRIWELRTDLYAVSSSEARTLLPNNLVAVTQEALPLVPAEVDANARYSAIGRTLALIGSVPNTTVHPDLLRWDHDFGRELRLFGGKVERNGATGEYVALLSWLALAQPSEDWSVSVRLLRGGQEIGQVDNAAPVHGAYPMTRWAPGEVVNDAYAFALPQEAEPEGVRVILYRPEPGGGFTNLGVAEFAVR